MVDQDDLEFNPFYQALQSQFLEEFNTAQDHCYLVCIPQIASLAGVKITKVFVETHLLKPSPLLKDNYHSSDRTGSKIVILDGRILTTMEGFATQREVKVVAQELCYNRKYKPYKMLIIESPLEGGVRGRRGSGGLSDEFLNPRTSFVENVKFLNMFPENRFQLLNLDKSIQQFNKNYLMVSGYLQEAAKKLQKIWQENRDALLEANNMVKLQSDGRLEEAISIATESYVMGGVYNKVSRALLQQCEEEDSLLSWKVEELKGVRGEDLGLKSLFCCPLANAVVEIARLDGICCPFEKLVCLKETIFGLKKQQETAKYLCGKDLFKSGSPISGELIWAVSHGGISCDNRTCMTNEVTEHIKEHLAPGDTPDCLTSDDLIPLLVLVISQAKCQHLASNLLYVELFHWVTSKNDDMGYTLVTFKAAKEYMKSTDFSHLSHSKLKMKKEMSIEEIMIASGFSNEDSAILGTTPTNANPQGFPLGYRQPFRREMENISKMVEQNMELNHQKSSTGLNRKDHVTEKGYNSEYGKSKAKATTTSSAKMGDFLLALKNDVLDSTYGKQD